MVSNLKLSILKGQESIHRHRQHCLLCAHRQLQNVGDFDVAWTSHATLALYVKEQHRVSLPEVLIRRPPRPRRWRLCSVGCRRRGCWRGCTPCSCSATRTGRSSWTSFDTCRISMRIRLREYFLLQYWPNNTGGSKANVSFMQNPISSLLF